MDLVKDSIRSLKGYKVDDSKCRIKLDANEGKNILLNDGCMIDSDFQFNIYPDNDAVALREEISRFIGLPVSNILPSNGSSEMIELIIKTFADKDEIVLSFTPTFSMYSIFSQIYSARFVSVESNEDFSFDIKKLVEKAKQINPKVIFLCNPNNPSGCSIGREEIIYLIENTNSIVVIDEAYIEFGGESVINEVSKYSNLIVLRTLSKAFGLAALRLGYMISNCEMVDLIGNVKAPYSLNAVSQYIGVKALRNSKRVKTYIDEVKIERDYIYSELKKLNIKANKSDCNFVFFYLNMCDFSERLQERGILIRSFSGDLKNYYRVTVGSSFENREFIKAVKEIIENENCRDCAKN